MNTKQSGYIFVVFISFVLSMDPAMGRIFGGGRFMQSGGGCSGGSCGGSVRVSPGGSCRGGSCGSVRTSPRGGCQGGSCQARNSGGISSGPERIQSIGTQASVGLPALTHLHGNLHRRTQESPNPNDALYYWLNSDGTYSEIRVWNTEGPNAGLLVDERKDVNNPLPLAAAQAMLDIYSASDPDLPVHPLVQMIRDQYADSFASAEPAEVPKVELNHLVADTGSKGLESIGPNAGSSKGISGLRGFDDLAPIGAGLGNRSAGPGTSYSQANAESSIPRTHAGAADVSSGTTSRALAPEKKVVAKPEGLTAKEPMLTLKDLHAVLRKADENTRVLVTFGADWCPGCVELKGDPKRRIVGKDVSIEREYERENPGKKLVWYKVDVSDSRKLPPIYDYVSPGTKIPHTWVYKGAGPGADAGKSFTGSRNDWRNIPILANDGKN